MCFSQITSAREKPVPSVPWRPSSQNITWKNWSTDMGGYGSGPQRKTCLTLPSTPTRWRSFPRSRHAIWIGPAAACGWKGTCPALWTCHLVAPFIPAARSQKTIVSRNGPNCVWSVPGIRWPVTMPSKLEMHNAGVVRQSLTRLKAPRSHKSMKRRFETTPWERHCVFACKSIRFEDVFHDWSGSGLELLLKRIFARFGLSLKY